MKITRDVLLIGLIRLPSKPRIDHGLKITCDVCGKKIEDEIFLCGFVTDQPNLLMHESCVPDEEKSVWLKKAK